MKKKKCSKYRSDGAYIGSMIPYVKRHIADGMFERSKFFAGGDGVTGIQNRMKIIILVLMILLGFSIAALTGVVIYREYRASVGSAVIPNNYIASASGGELDAGSVTTQYRTVPVLLYATMPNVNRFGGLPVMRLAKTVITSDQAKETVISIYKNHAEDSSPFRCPNMFPGDSETKPYLVEVSHKGTVTVRFRANIREGYEKLSEVLKCRVVLNGNETLYDGLMRDMPGSLNHRITSVFGKTTELTYDITVYLDTSVGNAYMNQELVADFRWWVEESGGDSPPVPDDTTTPAVTTAPDSTEEPEETTLPKETTDSVETTTPAVTTEPVVTTDPVVPPTPDEPDEPDVTTTAEVIIPPEVTTAPDETTETEEITIETEPDETRFPESEITTWYEPDDPGELIEPPKTGDTAEFLLWFWIIVLVICTWITMRRSQKLKQSVNERT